MSEEIIHNGHLIQVKKFGCIHCEENFDNRRAAEKHVEKQHPDLVPEAEK